MRNFTQYVHEFTDDDGKVCYTVAQWDADKGEYVRPPDNTEAQLTGCSWEVARVVAEMQNFPSRKQALRRARYLFYELDQEWNDYLAELDEETS